MELLAKVEVPPVVCLVEPTFLDAFNQHIIILLSLRPAN
jgi:hypothetical protein